MWIFMEVGFFSVVASRNAGELCVRARVREDLDRLREKLLPELGKTQASQKTDYPYRAFVKQVDFAQGMARAALSVNYPNFKARILSAQGHAREALYGRVWSVMNDAEQKLAAVAPLSSTYLMGMAEEEGTEALEALGRPAEPMRVSAWSLDVAEDRGWSPPSASWNQVVAFAVRAGRACRRLVAYASGEWDVLERRPGEIRWVSLLKAEDGPAYNATAALVGAGYAPRQ